MMGRRRRSSSGQAARSGGRRGVAVGLLVAVILALAGPLLGPGLGTDPTYCCRAGRCCCDSGKKSPEDVNLKTACGCARPGQEAAPFGLPLGLLVADAAVSAPVPADLLWPVAVPQPRMRCVEPLEHPPPPVPLLT